jgi:hypothetical protein
MKSSFALFLILIISSPILFAQENDWVKTKDLELAYRIDFPEKVERSSQSVPTAQGSVEMISYTLNSSHLDNLIYMSSFTEYPSTFFVDGLDTLEKQYEVLDRSVNGAVNNVKGQLISDDKITFNGYPGRIIKIGLESGGESYIIRMKTLLVGFKLYLMQTISLKENDDNLDTKRFFDSFELINVKE